MQGMDVGQRRAASALVRCLGGDAVRLEIPAPPVADDDDEQLGLRTPEFQAKVLAPVAVRASNNATEVLVAADALESLVGASGFGAVQASMTTVYAVVIGDVRYRMTSVECVRSMGEACVYRLILTAAGTEVV